MERIKTDKARSEFGTVINRVAFGKEWIVLERRNKPLAALIPMEDLELLERLIAEEEDRIDLEAVRAAEAEPGPDIPLDEFMKERGSNGTTGRAGARGTAKQDRTSSSQREAEKAGAITTRAPAIGAP